jgi:hypothetical protein
VDLGSLTTQVKKLVEKRGGVNALKGDAEELKDIVRADGSATGKAKLAARALKDPGQKPAKKKRRPA